eukprot:4405008-Amphidinium_carterae.1
MPRASAAHPCTARRARALRLLNAKVSALQRTAGQVWKGSRCPQRAPNAALSIEVADQHAAAHGGLHGHEWTARASSIFSAIVGAQCGATGRPFELDGLCEELQLAFEYNGEYHYQRNNYWNLKTRRGAFSAVQARCASERACASWLSVWPCQNGFASLM